MPDRDPGEVRVHVGPCPVAIAVAMPDAQAMLLGVASVGCSIDCLADLLGDLVRKREHTQIAENVAIDSVAPLASTLPQEPEHAPSVYYMQSSVHPNR